MNKFEKIFFRLLEILRDISLIFFKIVTSTIILYFASEYNLSTVGLYFALFGSILWILKDLNSIRRYKK